MIAWRVVATALLSPPSYGQMFTAFNNRGRRGWGGMGTAYGHGGRVCLRLWRPKPSPFDGGLRETAGVIGLPPASKTKDQSRRQVDNGLGGSPGRKGVESVGAIGHTM